MTHPTATPAMAFVESKPESGCFEADTEVAVAVACVLWLVVVFDVKSLVMAGEGVARLIVAVDVAAKGVEKCSLSYETAAAGSRP